MKNTIQKIGAKKICILAFALVLALTAFTFMNFRNSFSALASQSANYDLYTNDDYFQFNGNRHSIRDYPTLAQPLRGNVGTRTFVGLAGSDFDLDLGSADDAIPQIVPRELFMKANETLHIGDQYGFFISTIISGTNSHSSTVMVFDISTKTDLTEHPLYSISSEVEPIFQRRYAYLKAGSGSVSFQYEAKSYYIGIQTSSRIDTKTLSYSNLSNDRIIAMPSRAVEEKHYGLLGDWSTDVAVFYDNVNDYYLKDISFSASLSNVDKLNHGETGYNPYQDDGYFMHIVMCNFGGSYYVRNAPVLDKDVIYNNIFNTFKFVAGFTPASPIIDVIDGIQLAGDWFGLANQSQTLETEYILE